jgi:hypothetical protein
MLNRRSLRSLENIHVPLWLIKDTCWMLGWKWLGTIMIVPTIGMAIYITYQSRKKREFYLNIAICSWVSANAWWMSCEFFDLMTLKNIAAVPFLTGMLMVGYYYFLKYRQRYKLSIRDKK